MDIYRWGPSLAVTGPIRDIGQNFYRLLFKQEAITASVTATFFIAFVYEAFNRNYIVH
jgi:hypothetical protein